MRFEIRRLHDTTGVTMIYVTHDQTEAMVCADRIAVMNKGRLEQIGAASEIYERPRTKFVAAFIGRCNTLPGKLKAPGVAEAASATLHGVDETGASSGAAVSVCIRPHRVALGAAPNGPANQLRGRVERVAYLGEASDCLIETADGTRLRAFASPETSYRLGEEVDVYLPIKDCRIVAE
jgi:iron(III) transport system ATP-binding protein